MTSYKLVHAGHCFFRLFRITVVALICLAHSNALRADTGYRLWMRYDKIEQSDKLDEYKRFLKSYWVGISSPTADVVRKELAMALPSLLAIDLKHAVNSLDASLIITTISDASLEGFRDQLRPSVPTNPEGFFIATQKINGKKKIIITSTSDLGLLYGTFHFLRMLQTRQGIENVSFASEPRVNLRILNHWDNLDRTVERGYAGSSIWDWHKLPSYIDQRYHDYARANASIGINGTVLTNVNANALILTPPYLEKVKALADVFRAYGIRVYLTARFSAPIEIGGLKTADPLDAGVKEWWNQKVAEVYQSIPDFGGFVVKANSEGQPGPQNYGRSHSDGANLLATALKPFGGIVMWRAFVYSNEVDVDRTKQAYNEFKPLDGKFLDNVMLQVKNGPLDFQPREPFHPLFGAMEKTKLLPEFQITQEYLGFSTHLVFLAPLFKECLDADTYAKGEGSTVAKVIDGTLFKHNRSAMAGVSNIGSDLNWTGHQFAQANWYAFGRLAWNHQQPLEEIADEWIRQTFSNDKQVVEPLKKIMLSSRETLVKYMNPLGLHHIMGYDHHYGPGPWVSDKPRKDWTSVYYHRADSLGVGYDRSPSGSNAVEQYSGPVKKKFSSLEDCPEAFLLWFHHVPWSYKLKSGNSLWEELCYRYHSGVNDVKIMKSTWESVRQNIDEERYRQVYDFLMIQEAEAKMWRDACILYFQTFSRREIPGSLAKPDRSLDYYMQLSFPYAPGIKPKW